MDQNRSVCGDPACQGGYTFIGNSPAKKKMDYIETWKEFSKYFRKLKYKEVPRKPVVARWREDTYWVGASVYGFQPYVVSGEIKPPAESVIIPQLSLRFNDIDNVGITSSHYVCFDMMGQLQFRKKEEYDPGQYFDEYYNWIVKGMGVPKEELILHGDAWAGGGTFGPCIEFFSRGLEIGNQVYMQYKVLEKGYEELDIKVLDMGQGQERVPWFTQGTSTSYETTFPTVVKRLKESTGVKLNEELMQKFLPYAAFLNVDEVEDVDKTWGFVAQKVGMDVKELKDNVLPLAAVYSIAEHSRAALVALNDWALPSNVGGGYNLRTIIRRMLWFNDKYGWDLDLGEIAGWHTDFLKPIYPELRENIEEVKEILENEKKKYEVNKEKSKVIIEKVIENGKVGTEKLLELYDSHGINPGLVKKEAAVKNILINVPDDFYARLSERHEQGEQKIKTQREEEIPLGTIFSTEKLYWGDWKQTEFEGKVLKIIEKFVVLDKSAFYPTSGGQVNDIGTLNGVDVLDVFVQDGVIIHKLAEKPTFKEGNNVKGQIDFERRKQLMQHHTGAHLINGAAREILGEHSWQAGAAKTPEKGRLDITHFETPDDATLKKIEDKANHYIKKNLKVEKFLMAREKAEEKYGMRIYQGGFIPGHKLRIVNIKGLDIEACGGTHANSTGDIENIKILNATKIQDGVIRINYVAGKAALQMSKGKKDLLEETALVLGVDRNQIVGAAEQLFSNWKKARKALKKGKKVELDEGNEFKESKLGEEELLKEVSKIFATQAEYVPKTAKRFKEELDKMKKELNL